MNSQKGFALVTEVQILAEQTPYGVTFGVRWARRGIVEIVAEGLDVADTAKVG